MKILFYLPDPFQYIWGKVIPKSGRSIATLTELRSTVYSPRREIIIDDSDLPSFMTTNSRVVMELKLESRRTCVIFCTRCSSARPRKRSLIIEFLLKKWLGKWRIHAWEGHKLRQEFIYLAEASTKPFRQSLSTNLTPGLWFGADIAIVKV